MEQLANDYNEGLNNYYNGICLDVNQDKEESQYNVIIKSLIAGKCSTTESIMTQIAIANLTNNDTAKINTYKDKFQRLDGEIEILTNYTDGLDIFMDNFTVYALTHTDHIIKKVNTEDPTKQSSDTGKYNSSIRNFLHNNIPVKDRDCYIGIKAIGCKKDKEGILSKSQKETYNNLILGGINNISNDYSILKYKISTSELKLKQLINIFTTDNILNGLNKSGLYICDYDITTDLKGCIDKELFINYLLKNHNFTFGDGKRHKNIIENDSTVSNTCLSFWLENETGFLRVKLYDKFKQSMESGSVRGNVGSHFNNWINNPGVKLRDTF